MSGSAGYPGYERRFDPEMARRKCPPESLLTPHLAPSKPFTGCIRHFVIDGRPVSFSKAALVSGAVSINSCPTA